MSTSRPEHRIFDEANLFLKAGDGGSGCVSFRREKYIENGGPNGGNGGNGGNITIIANKHTTTLRDFRFLNRFTADDGDRGQKANRTGKGGKDITVIVPVGTVILNEEGLHIIKDLTSDGDSILITKGGKGGRGNATFKSSVKQAPRFATPGEEGEALVVKLKLKIFCDIGLVGLPNAGKSMLIKQITNSKAKVSDYAFTTLSPNLGIIEKNYEQFVIGDIPGLIEGASDGKGLGNSFLKHIERCNTLVHVIDISSEDPIKNYQTIKAEIQNYDKKNSESVGYVPIQDKKEFIVLNKTDLLPEDETKEMLAKFKKFITASNKKIKSDTPSNPILSKHIFVSSNFESKEKIFKIIHIIINDIEEKRAEEQKIEEERKEEQRKEERKEEQKRQERKEEEKRQEKK